MRVAIATESFLPQTDGVSNSVQRISEYLRDNGHDAIIIPPAAEGMPTSFAGFPVIPMPAITLPMFQDVRVGVTPSFMIDKVIADFAPDVVHVAGPFMNGYAGLVSAAHFSIPSVAVYQTDIPAFAGRYGFGILEAPAWIRVRDMHLLANLTLAPSTSARDQLIEHGIPRVKIWGRGVDTTRFNPAQRDEDLHNTWAPNGEVVIGYMGRLAPEKQISDLAVLADLPGTRLVLIGEGPSHKNLLNHFPTAVFTGHLAGDDLARAVATLDVFVHPGELETFCQAIQESLASGVPVVATGKGGPIDLIDHGHWGYLYPPGDLTAMRSYVEQLVGDADLRRQFSRAGREFTSNRTWPLLCDQLIGYYEEAIAMTAGAVPDLR
ncbi:MAG: glycosyltransferase family 1 protein [Propionibacteriaceae bacterium]|nr:glycosyltransferase family 1 protein [Propionibacteriaceae bacterium]